MLLLTALWRIATVLLVAQSVTGSAAAPIPSGDDPRTWLAAAERFPEIADWLLRRAAIGTRDQTARRALYDRIVLPVVRDRLLLTEAETREALGDFTGAAIRFDSLGRFADATRLRLKTTTQPAARVALRQRLVDQIGDQPGTAESEQGIELVFTARLAPPAAEARRMARAVRSSRMAARVVELYRGPIAATLMMPADWITYGQALARLGRHREAILAYDRIPPASRSVESEYQRAVSLARMDQKNAARIVLARLLGDHPEDTVTAPRALYLAGDLSSQQGDRAIARRAWLELVERFPRDPLAGRAGFLAGLIEWEAGRQDVAGEEWGRLTRQVNGTEGLAAGYWAGRAYAQIGDQPRAEQLWASVIARDSLSYYSVLSAQRLGIPPWRPAQTMLPERFKDFPSIDSAMTRMALLQQMDLPLELNWEREALVASVGRDPERLLATADAFRRDGQHASAVGLARRALLLGAPSDSRTYRLIYPLLHRDDLFQHSERMGLDPLLVAALIRQESVWDTTAKSRVGALGLMQLMPSTASQVARALGVRRWKTANLLDPAINLRFGTYYLAQALRRFDGNVAHALAGYNAGPSRIATWSSPDSAEDPELFTERIGFTETRNYVRIIQRNAAVYRALYGGATQ